MGSASPVPKPALAHYNETAVLKVYHTIHIWLSWRALPALVRMLLESFAAVGDAGAHAVRLRCTAGVPSMSYRTYAHAVLQRLRPGFRSARTSALGNFMLTLSSVLPSILKEANSGYHTGLHQSKHHTKHPANESSAAAG